LRTSDLIPGDDASNVYLRAILAGIADGVTAQDSTGRLVYANDAAAQTLGFQSAAEMLAAPVATLMSNFELLDEDGQPLPISALPGRLALHGETAPKRTVRYRILSTGEERWSEVQARPVLAEDGTVALAINIWHDITAQVLRQRELEANAVELIAQQQMLEQTSGELQELTSELEATVDELNMRTIEAESARSSAERAEERARFLSEAGRTLASSLDYETTLPTVVRLAVPSVADWCTVHLVDDLNQVRRLEVAHANPDMLKFAIELEQRYPPDPSNSAVHRVVATGKSELYPEVTPEVIAQSARDPEHLRLLTELNLKSAMVVPLIARDRAIGAVTLIAAESGRRYDERDLTLAEELARRAATAVDNARLYQEARESSRAKSEFLATMSHELRTPLNAIVGYTDLLEMGIDGPLKDHQLRHIERIKASSRHLIHIIDEILSFSRLEAARETLRYESVSLGVLAREAADMMEPAVRERGLTLTVDVPGQDVTVQVDPAKVRQILINLISNAVKFTETGNVRVRAWVDEEDAIFEVEDTGIGIAPEHLERVFEPFWQVDQSSTRRAVGTGLGLAVSRGLARLMGGELSVASTPGKSTRLTLRVPKTR
jgi:PAS domain S-box-containing protein